MEEKEDSESCGVMRADEVPVSYHVVARNGENPSSQFSVSVVAPVAQAVGPSVQPSMDVESAVGAMQVVNGVVSGTEMKKKRGRLRKYGPDGKPTALSPMPISASIKLAGQLLSWKPSQVRPVDLFKKKRDFGFESPDSQVACSVGANFTPHMITVNAGEDVSVKILSFSQQRSRAICILAANGSISNVTLHQPNPSGGT